MADITESNWNELNGNQDSTSGIVFIDPSVENYQSLIAGVAPGSEVFLLDSTRDGVEQISEVLAGRSGVSSIHIVSHGGSGSLQLGGGRLSLDNLGNYASQLQGWSGSLTEQADILLYGCDVAAGEQGTAFVNQLSLLTGADVAASTDLTGSAALGGDWDLETTTGNIEAPLAFQLGVMEAYTEVLAATINTIPSWNGGEYITNFGEQSNSGYTFGQTFRVPTGNDILNSFEIRLNDNSNPDTLDFAFYIMAWDGAKATGPILYESSKQTSVGSPGFEIFTFNTGNLSLNPGQQYVAFISASKFFDGIIGTGVQGAVGSNPYAAGQFVYDGNGSDFNQLTTTTWDSVPTGTLSNFDIAFTASFSSSNTAPTTSDIPNVLVQEDAPNTVINLFPAFADAQDSDAALRYTIRNNSNSSLFSGTTIDPVTGQLTLDYAANVNGTGNITIRATDTEGLFVETAFGVNVNSVNDAPTVANAISDKIVAEDEVFNFIVPATAYKDVDTGDTLTYTATLENGDALPSWLQFNELNRTFNGTPNNGDVGSVSVKVTATDTDGAKASDNFNLSVTNTNDAPTLETAIGNKTTAEDEVFSFIVPATTFEDVDADDSLTYAASLDNGDALPDWLTFDENTRTFSGTPANDDVGNINVKVTATDSANTSVSDTFNLIVDNVNDAPTLETAIGNKTTAEDDAFSFTVPATAFDDVDTGDSLTYSASREDGTALPEWLNFNAATRTFTGTPANGDVGSLSLKVTATDDAGAKASDTFNLNVTNVNDAPELTNNNRLTLKERTTSTITNSLLNVTDVDNTPADITYKVTDSTDFGALKLNGVALAANSIFTQANINDNKLTYTHNPIETASDKFAFTVTDGAGDSIGATVFNIGVTPVNETLNGTSLNDTINGLAGNDTINGLAGIDNLKGGSGNDIITGGSGNDNLAGNTGFDVLTGGAGADRFIFNSKNEGRDGIIDFSVVDDTLVVSKAGFGGGLTANAAIAAAQFQLGSAANDKGDRFIYNKNTGSLFFDADGMGGAAQVHFAQISTGLDMTYRDIFVAA